MSYSIQLTFSKDEGFRTIHFESVLEHITKSMLTRQRLLRSRPELNSDTARIFWYMMDEHMYFWYHPEIVCSRRSNERFLQFAYISFEFWILDLTDKASHKTIKCFEGFNQWMIRRRNQLLQ